MSLSFSIVRRASAAAPPIFPAASLLFVSLTVASCGPSNDSADAGFDDLDAAPEPDGSIASPDGATRADSATQTPQVFEPFVLLSDPYLPARALAARA